MSDWVGRVACALAVTLSLAACTAEQVENGALSGAKSWCRNTPQSCTVHDESR